MKSNSTDCRKGDAMENFDKRREILKAAAEIIEEKGLSNTSTNDIVKRLGIARGTLYHYFKSKEEIIDALAHEMTEKILDRARETAREDKPVIDRFWNTIKSLNADSGISADLLSHIHLEENLKLHHKIQCIMISEIPKILMPIVEDGTSEALFNPKNPYVALEMMVVYVTEVIDSETLNLSDAQKAEKIFALIENMEILLGCESGMLMQNKED